ncbi:MAG: hypothetical protein WCS43_17520 [Verrucomicrobiota bacterium]
MPSICSAIPFPFRKSSNQQSAINNPQSEILIIPPPPKPPFDIETFEPIEPPWQTIKEWIPDDEPDLNWFNQPRKPKESDPDWFDQSPQGALASRQRVSDDGNPAIDWFDQQVAWKPPEIPLDDGRILVLEYT